MQFNASSRARACGAHMNMRCVPHRVGTSGGESDDAKLLAVATATAAKQDITSSVTVTRGIDNSDEQPLAEDENSIMDLLPAACRQGILCRVSTLAGGVEGGERGGEGAGQESTTAVVLLGSTLRGTGVFSGRDAGWFERVCAHLVARPAIGAAIER